MGLAGTAISAAGGIMGGIMGAQGAEQQGQATSTADLYQAQVAQNNAAIAQRNASDEMMAGNTASMNSGLQTRAKIGTMKAGQGANGVDVNTGSAAAVRAGADQTGYLDALTIRDNSAKKAYGYEVQGTSDTAQAGLDTMGASNARAAAQISADTSLISGATSVGKALAGYQGAAGFGG